MIDAQITHSEPFVRKKWGESLGENTIRVKLLLEISCFAF